MNRFAVTNGKSLAFQRWGAGGKKRVLCLHGWMDNSNSFSLLGPFLADRSCEVVAYDHMGHGCSDHNPCPVAFAAYVSNVKSVLDALGWQEDTFLVGHSMGANIGILFAACFPEKVSKLVLIEGLGPPSKKAEDTVKSLRRAVETETSAAVQAQQTKPKKQYPTLAAAIDARLKTVSTFPGSQTLSREAAFSLVARGCALAGEDSSSEPTELSETDGPVVFRHDPKVQLPSYTYLTEEQVRTCLAAIQMPTLLVTAENGWPGYADRVPVFAPGILTHRRTPGSHHCHLDPETSHGVAELIHEFLACQ